MPQATIQQVRADAARIRAAVEEVHAALKALRDAIPIDIDEVDDDMVSWRVCPSVEFYAYGALSSALESFAEAVEHLERAAGATPDAVDEAWRKFRDGHDGATFA